jgi:hypothetical protein
MSPFVVIKKVTLSPVIFFSSKWKVVMYETTKIQVESKKFLTMHTLEIMGYSKEHIVPENGSVSVSG